MQTYGKFAHAVYGTAPVLKWAIEPRQPNRLQLGVAEKDRRKSMGESVLRIPSMKGRCSPEEWQARVDLAACYRLVDLYGMSDMMATGFYKKGAATRPGRCSTKYVGKLG